MRAWLLMSSQRPVAATASVEGTRAATWLPVGAQTKRCATRRDKAAGIHSADFEPQRSSHAARVQALAAWLLLAARIKLELRQCFADFDARLVVDVEQTHCHFAGFSERHDFAAVNAKVRAPTLLARVEQRDQTAR